MADDIPSTIECPVCYKKTKVFARFCTQRNHYVCLECIEAMCCRATYVPMIIGSVLVRPPTDIGRCPLCRDGAFGFCIGEPDPWVGVITCPPPNGDRVSFRGHRYKDVGSAIDHWLRNPITTVQCCVCQCIGKFPHHVRSHDICDCIICPFCSFTMRRSDVDSHLAAAHGVTEKIDFNVRRSARLLQ